MFVDYHAPNEVIVKNKYPLPWIDDPFDQVRGACVFLKTNLCFCYHEFKIRESDNYPRMPLSLGTGCMSTQLCLSN
jgi:hypothetical protein